MARLVILFRGREEKVITGPDEEVRALEERLRHAMAERVDTVVSHELEGEPKNFLCSEVIHFHRD